ALNGGGLALDMGQDGIDLGHLMADFCFQDSNAVVSIFQAQAFVKLEMLLDVQISLEILNADIVHVEVLTSGDGRYAVKNILAMLRTGNRVDHDVCVRKHVVNGRGDGVGNLFGALKGYIAVEPNGEISKVAVSSSTDADAIYFEQTIHAGESGDNFLS